jgi:hypothetical protein
VIGAYENIRAPEVNLALVRDVFSMDAIAQEMPGVYELVKRNRVTSQALQNGLFRLIVAFETLVAAGLVLGTLMLGLAIFGIVDRALCAAGCRLVGPRLHPDLGPVSGRRQLVPLLGGAQKHPAHPLLHDLLGHSDLELAGMRACLAFLLCLLAPAAIAQEWQVQTFDMVSASLFAERCQSAPQGPSAGLPDGCVASGSGDVRAAWYTQPTDRYAHAILGDALEAGALTVRLASGAQTSFVLPDSLVFEDRTPRLADLDGDGRTEIITIRSSVRAGGSVAVYGVRGEAIVELGATPFIGRANRWLNIAGIADFLGRGDLQVAFVETPHIGGTLTLASFDGNGLRVVARQGGFSNHEIGAREQRLAAVADFDGDGAMDLLLPDARRQQLLAVRFAPQLARLAVLEPGGGVRRIIQSPSSPTILAQRMDGTILQISW